MKTLLNLSVLLVSLGAFASSNQPEIAQYWFDNNQSTRFNNTGSFVTPLTIDASGLKEGAHTLNYRMADKDRRWGRTYSKMFLVPTPADASKSTPVAYRILVNNDVVAQDVVPSGSSFELTPEYPEKIILNSVNDRSFKYLIGEEKIRMTAKGVFSFAVQLMSDQIEWGAPFYKEIDHQVITSLPFETIDVPGDYSFEKVDNNNFKAYKFKHGYSENIYIKASQDCRVDLYRVDEGYDSNLSHYSSTRITKGETVKLYSSQNSDMIAVFYDTPVDKNNTDSNVSLRFMLEDNKVPTPVIDLDNDTWEVTISCDDKRAIIYYTTDGEKPTTNSLVYTEPFELKKFTRVMAYAVYGDLANSEIKDMQYGSEQLQIPLPVIKYVGGEGMNEFVWTNRVEGVTTYYCLGDLDLDDGKNRILFDGTPFAVEDGTIVKAFCEKDNLATSETFREPISLGDYTTSKPRKNNTKTEGEDFEYYSTRQEYVSLYVPEGQAYYRFVNGKQEFSYGDQIVEGEWKLYDRDANDGWIELPGGALSGNQTLQVYAITDGKARSAVENIYTDWVIVKKPKVEYNNYKLKLSTDIQDAKVFFNLGYENRETAEIYDAEKYPDGLDINDQYVVSFWTEADGYENSYITNFYRDNWNLESPHIEYQEDGYLHVYHEDENVTVKVECEPKSVYEQTDYLEIAPNHIRFTPDYNTNVRAYVERWGWNNSGFSEKNHFYKPEIRVNGYNVYIDWGYDGEIYYTTDGSKPTKESNLYEGSFDSEAGTIRAVAFYVGAIPAEADPVEVLDQTERPVIEFNYSMTYNEDGDKQESKKIRLTCPTNNAKIYYSLDRSLTDSSRILYEGGWDGVDVGDAYTIYAYAEADGYRRSEESSKYIHEGYLSEPYISVSNDTVRIWHDDPSVRIVPTFTPAQEYTYDEEKNEIICKAKYNTVASAHVEKFGYMNSSEVVKNPADKPVIRTSTEDYSFYIDDYWNGYIYYTMDGSTPTAESSYFQGNWVNTDGQACTIRAVRFNEGQIPSEADVAYVLHRAPAPQVEFHFSKSMETATDAYGEETEVEKEVKKITFSCDVPNAKITYKLNNKMSYEVYDPATDADGIDVSETNYLYAYAEAEGYRRSTEITTYMSEATLDQPNIAYLPATNTVEITHSKKGVTIVPTFFIDSEEDAFEPEDLNYDKEANKITCTVPYNTHVRAYAKKDGSYDSYSSTLEPLDKPYIEVNGFNVSISNYSTWYTEVYYTADGSMPTKESTRYESSFDTIPCTIRAVAFRDGYIPCEANSVKVMNITAKPEIVFNFDRATDRKKVKFTSATPDAKFYWSFDEWDLNYGESNLWDPEKEPEGIDVSDRYYNTLYFYAEADGYRRSDPSYRYLNEAMLNEPYISIIDDTTIEITHDNASVEIVPTFYIPSQDTYYTPEDLVYTHDGETNKITCTIKYSTEVKAHAEKEGYYASTDAQRSTYITPTIVVDGYYVYFDNNWTGETYYTTDGSMPTRDSYLYDGGFTAEAGTIRAVLFADGYVPAEATPVRVYDPTATPEIDVDNGFAKLSSATPNATIYYSLDRNINNNTRQVYDPASGGIDVSTFSTLYAYAEADDYRRSETLDFYKSNYTLTPPSLTYKNGYVTAEHDDDDVLVKFFDGDGKELTPEADNARRVQAPYNTTVKAYTYKKGYVNSQTQTVSSTTAPDITADLFTVTIKGKSFQTFRYTTDGSMPTASSKLYNGPFTVTSSCKVRAVAFAEDMIPAEGTSLDIAYRKSLQPEVSSYDGRYLTLKAEEGSTIKYVIGQNENINNGQEATGKIDAGGLNEIKAIAQRSDADDSEVFTFTPDYYANETDVYTSKAGVLAKAFDWNGDKSGYTSLTVHGPILGSETEDNGGYEFLRSLPALRHLDLTNVTDAAVPAGAFNSMDLLSVVLPANMKTAGELLFGEDNNTLCSVELQSTDFAPANLLDGVKNPNLLLYVRNKNLVTDLSAQSPEVTKNVIVLGSVNSNNRAENVTLAHGGAFYAPKEFTAQKITYTRAFTKETQIGGFGSGWETMIVPFDVQTISCGNKVCKPFGDAETDRGECPFWLFSGAETDWMAETSLMANTPYLIAFPNNPLYAEEYVVNGNVEFSSSNVSVPVTPEEDDMTFGFGPSRYIVGNYQHISKDEDVLALNEEVYTYGNQDFQPGGIFVAGQKDVVPFECFVWSESGPSAMPVFDQSAIDEIFGDTGVKIWSESYDIYIHSGVAMKVRIYDTVGQLVRSVNVKAGETVRVQDITPGIYFVGNYKLLVKK